jgi:glycosyltransferase involved in cell wall biosynthesis
MKPLNVLWVIDHVCYDGSLHGGGRLYWNVLPRFNPDRVRVVPCLVRATDEIREVFAASAVPVRILDKPKFDPTTLWTLLKLIRQERIDVMHLHCYSASTFGRLAGLLTGVPTIIHDYDTEVYFPYPSYLWIADRALAPATGHAIAASPMVRNFLLRKRHIDGGKITMLFHAVPAEKYEHVPAERTAKLRESLGAGPDTTVVGTLTKLGPQRGNEYLLKAAAQVRKARPNVLFVLTFKPTRFHRLPSKKYVEVTKADTDSQIKAIQDEVERLGISDAVRLVEWPKTVDELIAACDFIVAPFQSERFSSVYLLEAMAKGKPVVATAMGEQRELITDGKNGYLVTPGDAGELARRISQLAGDRAELQRLGRAARAEAEKHSANAYARRLEELYLQLAGNGRRAFEGEPAK